VQKARSWNDNKRNGGANSRVAVRAARVVPVIAGAALVFDMIGGFAMFAAAV
jgi:hypothetical protein